MTDIVARLYGHPGPELTVTEQFRLMVEQRHEAAAEIKRLHADNERLRALLQKLRWKSIDKDNMEFRCVVPYNIMDELRAALEQKP